MDGRLSNDDVARLILDEREKKEEEKKEAKRNKEMERQKVIDKVKKINEDGQAAREIIKALNAAVEENLERHNTNPQRCYELCKCFEDGDLVPLASLSSLFSGGDSDALEQYCMVDPEGALWYCCHWREGCSVYGHTYRYDDRYARCLEISCVEIVPSKIIGRKVTEFIVIISLLLEKEKIKKWSGRRVKTCFVKRVTLVGTHIYRGKHSRLKTDIIEIVNRYLSQ